MKRFNKFFACAHDVFQVSTMRSNYLEWTIPKVDLIIADRNKKSSRIVKCLTDFYAEKYRHTPEICQDNLPMLCKYDRSGCYYQRISKIMTKYQAKTIVVIAETKVIYNICHNFLHSAHIWFCPQNLTDIPKVDFLPGVVSCEFREYNSIVIDASDLDIIPRGLEIYSSALKQGKKPGIYLLGDHRNPYQTAKARQLLKGCGVEYSENLEELPGTVLLVANPLTCCRSLELLQKHREKPLTVLRCIKDCKLGDLWKAPHVSKKILLQNMLENIEAYARLGNSPKENCDYHRRKLDLFRQCAPQFKENLFQRIKWQIALRFYASYLKRDISDFFKEQS